MSEEIESRYIVPNRVLFDRLRALTALGPMTLTAKERARVTDCYLDTPGCALIRQGWACRLRSENGIWLATLKSPKQTQGAVVARSEWETVLPEHSLDMSRWPSGELQARLEMLTGGGVLRELARLRQTRYRFEVHDGDRLVGELSLDIVLLATNKGLRHRSLMLEIELKEDGKRPDLEQLDGILVKGYGLVPETRSKLRRALAFIEHGELPDSGLLQRIEPATVEMVMRRYGVDLEGTGRVAGLADRLAAVLDPALALSPRGLELLQAAICLYAVGREARRERGHVASRDILLSQPLIGLGEVDRQIIAAAAYLRCGVITPERVMEVIPIDWPEETRREALRIAALVRLAAALGDLPSGTVAIRGGGRIGLTWRVVLQGEGAVKAARLAVKRTDLWEMISAVQLEWAVAEPSGDGDVVTLISPGQVLGLNPWDAVPTAARKLLAHFFQQMLNCEGGSRQGEDPEALHDMRVATRRLRSALRLLGPYLTTPLAGRANQGLRRLGQALGAVRDMDVALFKANAYLEQMPEMERNGLEGLLADWHQQREQARRKMLRYLDSRSYTRLLKDMSALLAELERNDPLASNYQQIGRVAPQFLHLHWQAVRAYSAVLPNAPIELLHMLRIECKRLRYFIEFFRDVLAPEVTSLIPRVVALQDHLGSMRDRAITIAMIDSHLSRPRPKRARETVQTYRTVCQAEMQALLENLPNAWKRLDRSKMARVLERLVAAPEKS